MSQRPTRPKLLVHHRRDIEKEKKHRRKTKKSEKRKLKENVASQEREATASTEVGHRHRGVGGKDQQRKAEMNGHQHREKPCRHDQHHQGELTAVCHPQREPPTRKRQRWTELTAVGQILEDEVNMYLNPLEGDSQVLSQNMTNGERRHLTAWSLSVSKQISIKSWVVLDNVGLVSDLKSVTKRVKHLRDDLMVLRTQAKRLKEEAKQIGVEIGQTHRITTARKRASRYLFALESLASSVCDL